MTSLQRVIKYCAIAFAVFLSVSIISGICSAVAMVFGFLGGDSVGEMQTYSISGEITSLDIEIGMAAFEIVEGENFSVESNLKNLSVEEKDGVLQITGEHKNSSIGSSDASVVLTVPAGFVFEEADISAGAGELTIDTLAASELKLDLGAGETEIGSLTVLEKAEINNGAGELTIQGGELNDLSMDLGVGEMELTGKLTGDCTINYGVGETILNLAGDSSDYQIALDKGIGGATLDGETMSGDSVYGDGPNKISIDGGVGSLRIEFEETE